MRIIFKTLFGSYLYGLNTPESDLDYKAIAIPSGEDIIMQKAFKTINETTKPKDQAKNSKDDIDTEIFSLHQFIKLCKEGQTVALDMLFSTPNKWVTTSPEWEFIQANRDKLLHRKATAFVGYCQTQAAKYGIKGSRVAAMRLAKECMAQYVDKYHTDHGPLRVVHIWDELKKQLTGVEHIEFTTSLSPAGDLHMKEVETLEVCGRKIQGGTTTNHAFKNLELWFSKYGERAKKAETNSGLDWKAISHAFRVCYEAQELMKTGKITFPLAKKDFVLKIKSGALPYKEISGILEEEIQKVKDLEAVSILPEKINTKFWDDYIIKTYRKAINDIS